MQTQTQIELVKYNQNLQQAEKAETEHEIRWRKNRI